MSPELNFGTLNRNYGPKLVHTQSLVKKYDREWILENLEEARPNTRYKLTGRDQRTRVFTQGRAQTKVLPVIK